MKTKVVSQGSKTPDLGDFVAIQADFSPPYKDVADMVRRAPAPYTPPSPPQTPADKNGVAARSPKPIMAEMTPAEFVWAQLPGRVQQED